MKKNLFTKACAAALAAVLSFSVVACTSSTTNGESDSTKADAAAGSSAADSSSADGAATGATEVIKIGSTGPLTGAAASYGNSVKNGAEIAIKEINDAGGFKVGDTTYTFELTFLDDEAKEDMAVTAYNTLLDSKVDVLMAGVTSGATMAITDLSMKDNILQITPSGSVEAITDNPNVFRLCFTDPIQGRILANYAIEEGYESVAVLYNNADEYSTGIYDAFKEQLEAEGKSDLVVAEESFVTGDVDYTAQLTKIKSSGAKLIVVPAYYDAAAYIVQQAKTVGVEADFLGSDGWDGVLAQLSDTSVIDGAVFLTPFLATDESANVKNFVSLYEAAYKSTPDQFAADGYDTVYVLKAAYEKAGVKGDTDALIKAMTEISVDGVTGKVSFDETGNPNKEAKFALIENGVYSLK